jgi:hypothetical protein
MSATSVFKTGFLSIIAATGLFVASNGFAADAHTSADRIGGQAGQEYDQGKWESVAAKAGERIGGQAGLGYDQGNGLGYDQGNEEHRAAQAGERIGGQAGRGYDQAKRERVAFQ